MQTFITSGQKREGGMVVVRVIQPKRKIPIYLPTRTHPTSSHHTISYTTIPILKISVEVMVRNNVIWLNPMGYSIFFLHT